VQSFVKLGTVVDVDIVEVCFTSELIECVYGILRILGLDWEGVTPPGANVIDQDNVAIAGEAFHFFGSRVDMVRGDLLAELSGRIAVAWPELTAASNMPMLRVLTSLTVRVARQVRHLMTKR
jgi:hypothetical protein